MKAKLVALAMMALGLLGGPAIAAEMEWPIDNQAPFEVELQFYGQDRNVVWPGGGRVWYIRPGQILSPRLLCNQGEHICYGAWPTGDYKNFWGRGRGGRQYCPSCCFYCVNGRVKGHNLIPY